MFNKSSTIVCAAAAALALTALTGTASAQSATPGQTEWQKNHPRRAEVNARLANQNKRINNDVKNGTMSKAEAAKLHHQDRQVRQEERAMASQNGGHITKQEQGVLNAQENGISRKISAN